MSKDTRVTMSNGTIEDGVKLEVVEDFEGWCKFTLEDGTTIKLKPIVISAIRTNKYTDDGEPIYLVKSHNVVITDAPSELRKQM